MISTRSAQVNEGRRDRILANRRSERRRVCRRRRAVQDRWRSGGCVRV